MNAAAPSWYDEAEAASRADLRCSSYQDIAIALPVSSVEVAELEPGLEVTDCAHVATVLDEVRRLLGKRSG